MKQFICRGTMLFYLIFSCITAVFFLAAGLFSATDPLPTLSFLTPLINQLVKSGTYLGTIKSDIYLWTFVISAVLFPVIFLFSAQRGKRSGWFLSVALPLLMAIGAQYLFQSGSSIAGAVLYGLSIVHILLFWKSDVFDSRLSNSQTRFSNIELASLCCFWLLICCWRLYAINIIPGGWDDELCYHKIKAFSIPEVIRQHLGLLGGRTSEGLLWSFISHVVTANITAAPIGDRLIAAFIGLFLVQVSYFTFRYLFGPLLAGVGTVLVAFAPLEAGWARLPSLHHMPEIFTLLLVWFSLRSVTGKKWRDFFILAFLTAATNLLYPSGVFLFLIPVGAICHSVVTDWSGWKGHLAKVTPVVFGVLCWIFLNSVLWFWAKGKVEFVFPVVHHLRNILDCCGSKASWFDSISGQADMIITNLQACLRDLFVQIKDESHWSPVASFPPRAALSSIVAVTCVIGIALSLKNLKKTESFCYLTALAAALLPGFVSDFAERRVSGVFPALVILSLIAFRHYKIILETGNIKKGIVTVIITAVMVVYPVWSLLSQAATFFLRGGFVSVFNEMAERVENNYSEPALVIPLINPRHECMFVRRLLDKTVASKGNLGWVLGDQKLEFENSGEVRLTGDMGYYKDSTLGELSEKWRERTLWNKIIIVRTPEGKDRTPDFEKLKEYYDVRSEEVKLANPPVPVFDVIIAERR